MSWETKKCATCFPVMFTLLRCLEWSPRHLQGVPVISNCSLALHLCKDTCSLQASRFCKKCPKHTGREAGASHTHTSRWGKALLAEWRPDGLRGSCTSGRGLGWDWGPGSCWGWGRLGARNVYLKVDIYAFSLWWTRFPGKAIPWNVPQHDGCMCTQGSEWRFYNSLIWFTETFINRIINDKIKVSFSFIQNYDFASNKDKMKRASLEFKLFGKLFQIINSICLSGCSVTVISGLSLHFLTRLCANCPATLLFFINSFSYNL